MAKSKKKVSEEQSVPFEEALQQLQGIVEALESGTLGLEESLGQFEKGIGLLKTCNDVLERAEQRIEILTGVDAEGNPTTEPFDNQATIDQETPGSDDDASLF
ncbi:MAG: exodeoxyribonuclease VII small subunit [Planctomycetaceae bacterium]